jgi:hypothetical protein
LSDPHYRTDDDLNSINAMTPDPHTLMAVNASDSMSDALLNNQTLQTNSARDASATLAAQATAISPCFNSFIASDLHARKPGANRQAPSPCRDYAY